MIVLIGFMGAGKSTVGRLLARRLGLPFADSDDLIAAREGRSCAEIITQDGEPAFRRIEAQIVTEALQGPEGVLSLGGGAVETDRVRTLLEEHQVVFLATGLEQVLARVGGDKDRPMLAGDVAARFERREPLYRGCADVVADTDGHAPGKVAETIAALLRPRRGREAQ